MSDEKPLKSAYELAMERLREQDRRDGVESPKQLTADQKKRIAALREAAKAKLAQLEIMHRERIAEAGGDPDKIREVEEHDGIDRRRIHSELESAVARIKREEVR